MGRGLNLFRGKWAGLLFLSMVACSDESNPGEDAGVARDGGRDFDSSRPECREDIDCTDGVLCTDDFCDSLGVCRNLPNAAPCQDGVFCNGLELCDVDLGCQPGDAACDDGDVCTVPLCDEEGQRCMQLPRDADGDGEADRRCPSGTDCDDRDPTRGATFSELCDDAVDNDCDGETDEPECGRPEHDVCDDALDVSSGGTFSLNTDGATPDYPTGCSGTRRDLVVRFVLDEPRSVRLRADGQSVVAIEVRSDCADGDSAVECRSGFLGELRIRSLDAGTYFAVLSDGLPGELSLEVEFAEPLPEPTNQTCDSPTEVPTVSSTAGSFVDVSDDLQTSCGAEAAPDLVYEFVTTTPQNVEVSAVSESGGAISFAVRAVCGALESELRCSRGDPAVGTLYELPAGRYSVIVEGSPAREVDFDLSVRVSPPTPPPDGETCDSPLTLPLNAMVSGTLVGRQDDHPTVCGFSYRDVVYRFSLTEASDITVIVDGQGTAMRVSTRAVCDDLGSRVRCEAGAPARSRIRNLAPGDYFLIVEAFDGAAYSVSVETAPPTVPIPVSGNDSCDEAVSIPPTGGLYVGSTAGATDAYQTASGCGSMATSPDATFRLDLPEPQRVVASTEGSSFDTVLHLHTDQCASGQESSCDEDGGEGLTSVLMRTLGAGTHFFIVDGFGSSSFGDYVFEVTLTDP